MCLCQRLTAASSSDGHESASFSDIDLMEALDIGFGTWKTDKLFAMRTFSSNESSMHTVAERPIELRRVRFLDATPPLDGLAMHTRAKLWSISFMAPSTVPVSTSNDPDLTREGSSNTTTTEIPTTIQEPTS